MIFSNLFHRKKNKESETGSFSQYDQSEYAKLETKNIVKELNLSDAAQAKKYVVDLCKQMIQASKDIEDSKSEYQLVTNYLTDIQILEDLTDAERKPILECATQVAKLEKQRTDFLRQIWMRSREIWHIWKEKNWNGPCSGQIPQRYRK